MTIRTRKSYEFADAPPRSGLFWNRATSAFEWKIEGEVIFTLDDNGFVPTEEFANDGVAILDTGGDHSVTISPAGNEAANRVLGIPVLGGDDTIATLALAQTFAGVKTFTAAPVFSAAPLPTSANVTTTADGLTTGLIPATATWANVTSGAATNIATLPATTGIIGRSIRGYVGANGFEMRTPASSGATINSVDSDGTNEAAIPANSMFEATAVAADTWLLTVWDDAGEAAAPVPDTPA